MFKGKVEAAIPEGPMSGVPIEVSWDVASGITSNKRGVATVKLFQADIGPDRHGRSYRVDVAFDQGRARASQVLVSVPKNKSLPRQVSVPIDELVLWAVRLYATSSLAVFKVTPGEHGTKLTSASRRQAHSLAESQDTTGIPRVLSDSFLGDVARIYEEAITEGRSSWKAIEEHYGVSHASVGTWLQEARDRGFLKSRAPKRPKPASKRGKR